jgi:hypothetical protein
MQYPYNIGHNSFSISTSEGLWKFKTEAGKEEDQTAIAQVARNLRLPQSI